MSRATFVSKNGNCFKRSVTFEILITKLNLNIQHGRGMLSGVYGRGMLLGVYGRGMLSGVYGRGILCTKFPMMQYFYTAIVKS